METICSQKKLNNGLDLVKKAIGKSLPILSCVLISAKEDKIELSATNLEIGIKHRLSAQVKKEGQIVIPATLFSDFVERLPDKDVELVIQKNILKIKCGKFIAKINGLDTKDFPVIPEIKSEISRKIKQNVLKEALSQVGEVASTSEARPEISGIFVNSTKESTKFAATDSFRLAEKTIQAQFGQAIILPRQTVQELIRILDDKGKQAKISLDNNQILFNLGRTQVISRLIEGQYPDYQKIIPQDFETKVIINRRKLINNITIASLFAERTNEIQFIVEPQKSQIKIISRSSERGENKSSIKAKIEGKPAEIRFNYKYLLDGLNNILSDHIVIDIEKDPYKTLISPVGDNSYIYLVMPLKG